MQTEQLIIRFIKNSDIDAFYNLVSNKKIVDDMPLVANKTDAEKKLAKMVEDTLSGKNYTFALIYKKDNKFIGFIQLNIPQNSCGELSCIIHPDYWNKGLGSEGMLAIERFALEKLQLKLLRGVCTAFNHACTSLFKNVLDFEYICTQFINGKDYLLFEKRTKSASVDGEIYRHKLEEQLVKNNKANK